METVASMPILPENTPFRYRLGGHLHDSGDPSDKILRHAEKLQAKRSASTGDLLQAGADTGSTIVTKVINGAGNIHDYHTTDVECTARILSQHEKNVPHDSNA